VVRALVWERNERVLRIGGRRGMRQPPMKQNKTVKQSTLLFNVPENDQQMSPSLAKDMNFGRNIQMHPKVKIRECDIFEVRYKSTLLDIVKQLAELYILIKTYLLRVCVNIYIYILLSFWGDNHKNSYVIKRFALFGI
jgi:hypothetical protein